MDDDFCATHGDTYACEIGGEYVCAACVLAERDRMRAKLSRVADWIRFAANSDGGIAAEIDGVIGDTHGADLWRPR
jgi:hypothetical protein